MSLTTWSEHRWLTEHVSSLDEVAGLLAIVDRDLGDAATERLSPDWRLGISWNAILHLALLALATAGYRPARDRHHERAIASLHHTIGLTQQRVDLLDAIRRKRNASSYDRAGTVSASEAEEVYVLARTLRVEVLAWLGREHPELLPDS